MAITRTPRLALVGIAASAAILLSGCAATPSGAITDYSGWPSTVDQSDQSSDGTPTALWLEDGKKLAVVNFGSSSCPPIGTGISVVHSASEGNEVKITLATIPADRACTMDLVPHTTEFWTPESVSTARPLLVDVGGTTVTVPVKSAE